MSSRNGRRIVALLCLAALLLLSVSAPGHALPAAILMPFWVVLAVVLPLALRLEDDDAPTPAAPCLAVLPSRAPPAR